MPEAVEKETWDHPTFRVNDKLFVGCSRDDAETFTMTAKAPAGEQQLLLASGDHFFFPDYVGSKGWIGIHLDDATDWEEVAEIVEDSYRLIAPRRLVAELDT